MDDYANDILKLMDALLFEEAVICGLSMGGYVAFAMFRRAPTRVAGFDTADTRSTADTEDGVRGRQAMLGAEKGLPAVADQMIPKLLGQTSHGERAELVADACRQILANPRPGVEAAIYALMRRPDSTPDLPPVSCPTLVIGEEDTVTPPSDAEALARGIRNAELTVIAKAGHLSALEAPEDFSTTITRWLASLSAIAALALLAFAAVVRTEQAAAPPPDPLHRPFDQLLDVNVRDGLVYYRAVQSSRGSRSLRRLIERSGGDI